MSSESELPWAVGIGDLRFDADSGALAHGALGELLEHAPVAMAVTLGSEHRYAFANRRFRTALQPRAGELVGRTVFEVLGDLYTPEARATRDKILATGEPFEAQAVPIPLSVGGEPSFWDLKLFPVRDSSGHVIGVLTIGIEVTEAVKARAEAERQRKEAEYHAARLTLAIEATELGLWEWEPQTGGTYWSDRQKEIFGLPPGEKPDYDFWASALHPDDRDRVITEVARTLDPSSGGRLELEHRVVHGDGSVRWVYSRGQMVYESSESEARAVRLLGTVVDISERKRVEEERLMLLREINHRVLNLFAMVRSLIGLTARASTAPEDMAQRLLGRLGALARAHDLLRPALSDGVLEGPDTSLRALVEAVLAPHSDGDDRVVLDGPDVVVSARAATSVTLILHELATNAAKYGALVGGAGQIRVAWALVDTAVVIDWDEDGGPALDGPPPREGFGSKLVEASLKGLGGTARREWRRDGLRVRLSVDAERLRR